MTPDTPQDISGRLNRVADRYQNAGNAKVANAARAAARQAAATPDTQVAASIEQSFNAALPKLVAQTAPSPGTALQLGDSAGDNSGDHAVVYPSQVMVGGSRSWRNNNPGNIAAGAFAQRHGAIGADHIAGNSMAIFPTLDAGEQARMALLRNNYNNLTIPQAIARYASSPGDNPPAYTQDVLRATGFSANTQLSQLNDQQFQSLLAAMRTHEGFQPGDAYARGGSDNPPWAQVMLGQPIGSGGAPGGDNS